MRPSTALLSLLTVALVVVCVSLYSKTREDARSLDGMERNAQAMRVRYGQAVQEISVIQDSVNAIAVDAAHLMRISSLGAERKLSPTGGSETLARIAEVRARLQSLESRIQQSDIRIAGLDRLVKQLKQGLAEKEQQVAQLGTQVDSLHTHVIELNGSVEQAHTRIAAQSDTLEQRRRELGTVYYAIGTRQDLMKGGIVIARGGVLGLGKTLGPSNTADLAAFREVDTDQETVIPIAAAKARVLTPQPPQSYSIESVNGRLELHILDAQAFRRVKQLVIVTA
jgi:uncharacterized coiled-coil protein SlyX